jgi:hypothetical protein
MDDLCCVTVRLTCDLSAVCHAVAAFGSHSSGCFKDVNSGLGTSDCWFYILFLEAIQRFWYSPPNRITIESGARIPIRFCRILRPGI